MDVNGPWINLNSKINHEWRDRKDKVGLKKEDSF